MAQEVMLRCLWRQRRAQYTARQRDKEKQRVQVRVKKKTAQKRLSAEAVSVLRMSRRLARGAAARRVMRRSSAQSAICPPGLPCCPVVARSSPSAALPLPAPRAFAVRVLHIFSPSVHDDAMAERRKYVVMMNRDASKNECLSRTI